MMPNTKHVVGPPGTGKTWRMMEYVDAFLNNGFAPNQIAFVSFTRAAVREAKERVGKQFGIEASALPYFGTLHSLAYRSVGISREQVLTQKKWGEFCRHVDLRYTPGEGIPDDDFFEPLGAEEGDILRRFYDWARNCELELEEAAIRFDPGPCDEWDRGRAAWFVRTFEEWKTEEGLYDFSDFLTELVASGWYPPARVLIVDEAQDLSPLQRRIVLAWAEKIGHVLFAYDPDQAIFGFQGSDPGWLMEMGGVREFLRQSHRVPRVPAALCARIIGRNQRRYAEAIWKAKDADGDVMYDADLDQVVSLCASEQGSWYFLARNRHYLAAYSSLLMDAGVPFVNLRGHTPRPGAAVIAAFRLARGETVTLDDLRHLADETAQREWWERGAKAELGRRAKDDGEERFNLASLPPLGALPRLCDALSSIPSCLIPLKATDEKKMFHSRVYARLGMDGLTKKPGTLISTMHGVKGGQAENVVISPQMTRRTAESYDADPEPERRVWYVGASRTSSRLFILDPTGPLSFQEW